jgi:hypothetical protein
MNSSDEEDLQGSQMAASESEDEGIYPFRRNKNCDYYKVSFLTQFNLLRTQQLIKMSLLFLAFRVRIRRLAVGR